ncbi:MAG: glycosyltransferase family 1 protein [Magnetococcales bacterium]|nr:glycosyltransferase family 1 protein [Magnetococcales bacterium]
MLENNTLTDLLHTIVHLDEKADVTELVAFVQGGHDPRMLLMVLPELLARKRLRPAFLLAMLLNNNGYNAPAISVALSLGGWLFDKPTEAHVGLASLQMQADSLSFEQQQDLYDALLSPSLSPLLEAACDREDHGQILKILSIYQGIFPRFRTLFDWHAPVPEFSLESVRQQGRAQARLLSYAQPPTDLPRRRRRVVVAMRERFYFGNPASRPSDFGPRIRAAMQAYGWDVACSPFQCATLAEMEEDCQAIVALCRQQQAELLVIDLNVTIRAAVRDTMIFQLRQENPAIRIVGCLIDAFCFADDVLTAAAAHLDLVWSRDVPSLPLWQSPAMANRVVNLLFPNAGVLHMPQRPLFPQPLFAGGITTKYVPHRAFWLAAIRHTGLPIQTKISSHLEDGLSPLESFARYMQGLAEATCCLSLSMRYDQSHVVTFRSFEVVLSGALLLQEATPEMDYYFVAGEHYLPFSTLTELAAVMQFIRNHPAEAEEIRRCGAAFAREHYNDDRIIGHLDQRLFFQAGAVPPASPLLEK